VGPSLTTKSPAPLMPFSYTWVGGDIHGLSAFAGTLYGYVPKVGDVVTALDKKVHQIADDAGWQGSAASAFTTNWEKVAAETNALGLVIIETGDIVNSLAVDLAKIENALEQAADKAAAHGVQIGGDGKAPSARYASPAQEDWRLGYGSFCQQCVQAAENARLQAAGELQKLFGLMARSPASADYGPKVGEGATLTDYLADLLATPTAYSNQVARNVATLTEKAADAKAAWTTAQAAARQADGRFGVMPDDVKAALRTAKDQLASAQQDVTAAQNSENAFTKVFGTRLSDVPGVAKLADGISDSSLLGKALDIPVVDVLAAGVNTVVNAQADMAHGVPGWAAYPLEGAGSAVSIAAGTAVAGLVGGAVAGLSIAGAPVLGVAAGVAAGGVVAFGVGDYIHNYIQDFGQEWHQHGALGAVYDFGAAGTATWADTKQLAGDIGGAASSVWHGVTSIF
jgi:uncharacterized protein YukE